MANKIVDFTDIIAWQKGHELVLMIYKETKTFPQEEKFSLVDQMRRAAVSITSNIAEGFGRKGNKERIQFYHLSQGSLIEIKNQLIISRDVGYLSNERFEKIYDQANIAHRLLQGLITKTKTLSS